MIAAGTGRLATATSSSSCDSATRAAWPSSGKYRQPPLQAPRKPSLLILQVSRLHSSAAYMSSSKGPRAPCVRESRKP
jgi:hypothetical protein